MSPGSQPLHLSGRTASDRWHILYRGSLSSCNYDCTYCPFAKTRNTRAELTADAEALDRFVAWVTAASTRSIGILFTPWGEALVHRSYQQALLKLGGLDHVYRVAIQTNLSCRTDWLAAADSDKVALWATYHPSQTSRRRFLTRCHELDQLGIGYSVGMVGLLDDLDEIEAMRNELPPEVYLWVNAYKQAGDYYRPSDIERLTAVDPLFGVNLRDYASRGGACRAGHTTFTVDHEGTARRCHFIRDPIGNIHDPDFTDRLAPSPCTAATCTCHIGYVHRPELGLYEIFGDGLLERVPAQWAARQRDQAVAHPGLQRDTIVSHCLGT